MGPKKVLISTPAAKVRTQIKSAHSVQALIHAVAQKSRMVVTIPKTHEAGNWEFPAKAARPEIRTEADIRKVEYLDISDTGITDISALKGAVSLRSLNISNTKITDLSALSRMAKLKNLYMTGISATNWLPLIGAKGLKVLWVSGAGLPQVKMLVQVRQLKNEGILMIHKSLVTRDIESALRSALHGCNIMIRN